VNKIGDVIKSTLKYRSNCVTWI